VQIRPATVADHGAALRVIGDAFGFVVRPPSVHTVVGESPDGHLLVAERDGEIVGTGACVGFGPTGWLGGIAVAPQARGSGLGRALTEAAIDALGPRETVLLLASDAGRPIYERLGFEPEERYRSFWSPPDAVPVPSSQTRPLTLADRDAVLALDAHVTGEQRTLAVDVGLIGGVALPNLEAVALRPPWPARPILARDSAAGALLLGAVLEPSMRLAVPEANEAAIAALVAHRCTEGPSVIRMRRGAPVAWRPDELWGVFSLFFG